MSIQQLREDFARYLYLPRLRQSEILFRAITDGLGLLTWSKDSFAYADSFDEVLGRYRGLRCGQIVNVSGENCSGLLVKAETALRQHEVEAKVAMPALEGKSGTRQEESSSPQKGDGAPGPREILKPKRYHGSVDLDPTRVGRDAGRVADEVIARAAAVLGAGRPAGLSQRVFEHVGMSFIRRQANSLGTRPKDAVELCAIEAAAFLAGKQVIAAVLFAFTWGAVSVAS